jgi:hypothetical protein
MQGVCQQNHFPAVAQPFRVLWAPWSLALLGVVTALFTSVFLMIVVGTTIGGIALIVLLPGLHVAAIVFGLKLRYLSSIVTSLDNRRTGTTNLSKDKNTFDFANI